MKLKPIPYKDILSLWYKLNEILIYKTFYLLVLENDKYLYIPWLWKQLNQS